MLGEEERGGDVQTDGELTRKVMPWAARRKRDGYGDDELGEVQPVPERKKTVASIPSIRGRFLLAEERGRRGRADGGFGSCSNGRR